MTCNICGVNEATIHLTEIVNSQMVEIHLCESCAQEKGTEFKTHFNFDDLLSGFSPLMAQSQTQEKMKAEVCGSCGLTYEEFGKCGRLGCADCYQSFQKSIVPLIKRVQRSIHHIGKKPCNLAVGQRKTVDLHQLQDRLRKSIEKEEFEEAARLRDAIKKMSEKQSKSRKK